MQKSKQLASKRDTTLSAAAHARRDVWLAGWALGGDGTCAARHRRLSGAMPRAADARLSSVRGVTEVAARGESR
jgi:hypothetical protein